MKVSCITDGCTRHITHNTSKKDWMREKMAKQEETDAALYEEGREKKGMMRVSFDYELVYLDKRRKKNMKKWKKKKKKKSH